MRVAALVQKWYDRLNLWILDTGGSCAKLSASFANQFG